MLRKTPTAPVPLPTFPTHEGGPIYAPRVCFSAPRSTHLRSRQDLPPDSVTEGKRRCQMSARQTQRADKSETLRTRSQIPVRLALEHRIGVNHRGLRHKGNPTVNSYRPHTKRYLPATKADCTTASANPVYWLPSRTRFATNNTRSRTGTTGVSRAIGLRKRPVTHRFCPPLISLVWRPTNPAVHPSGGHGTRTRNPFRGT